MTDATPISTPANPVAPAEGATMTVEERDFRTSGQSPHLHRRLIRAANPWARLATLPGYGDHGGRYVEFMRWMAARGVECHALDFRGHGRSRGRRGYVRRWGEFLDDLHAFLENPELKDAGSTPVPPLFLLGHSHGGLVLALAAADGLPGIAGCILSAPYFRPGTCVPLVKRLGARIANVLAPWLRLPTGFDDRVMSSDPAMVADSKADPLLLHTATPRWYFGVLAAQREALRRAGEVTLPLLCLAGDADRVADHHAAAAFCAAARSEDKTFHLLPGRLHELLRETDRQSTFDLICNWMRERSRSI